MKKTIIICIIILLLATLAYLIEQKIKPTQNNQINIAEQGSFSNKMDCYGLKKEIEKDVDNYNKAQIPQTRTVDKGAVENFSCFEQKELKEIFFSNKLNSCLHVEIFKTICKSLMSYSSGKYAVSYETDYLIDTLTNKKIDFNKGLNFLQIIHDGQQFNSQEDADVIINEYK